MDRRILIIAAILATIAIVLGAFGAHALKERLDLQQLATFETGVRYQMYHALFLLFLAGTSFIGTVAKKRICYLTLTGVIFFSGSIYLLATQSLSGIDFKSIGIITPIGGLLLLAAWGYLLVEILRKKS